MDPWHKNLKKKWKINCNITNKVINLPKIERTNKIAINYNFKRTRKIVEGGGRNRLYIVGENGITENGATDRHAL